MSKLAFARAGSATDVEGDGAPGESVLRRLGSAGREAVGGRR